MVAACTLLLLGVGRRLLLLLRVRLLLLLARVLLVSTVRLQAAHMQS